MLGIEAGQILEVINFGEGSFHRYYIIQINAIEGVIAWVSCTTHNAGT